MRPCFKLAHRHYADGGTFGQVLLAPIEKRSGRAALLRGNHVLNMHKWLIPSILSEKD
jgi:hypothetical protein